MLSRRNVRIKVMQTLYSREHDKEKTIERLEKTTLESINAFYRCFLYNLYLLSKTAEYVIRDNQIQAAKFIQQEDKSFLSSQVFDNIIIQHIVERESLYQEIKREKMDLRADEDYFRQFFQLLKKTKEYSEYSLKQNPLMPEDKEIIYFIYKKILYPNEMFQQHIEDVFTGWLDDREAIYHSVINTIETIAPGQSSFITNRVKDMKEVKEYAIDLLKKTIYNEEEAEQIITPFLENWDKERLAMLDLLLMKMTVIEMIYFPSIPVKVSINEYIELAKLYSTPKSGEFINGILDSLMKKLKEENRIIKSGRGEKES
ncbi:MAG: transcription antitermination factor NusB [Chitinophagales bacterium]|nr:transcription antitermination factor NusB [Chitinophagales bacterium]